MQPGDEERERLAVELERLGGGLDRAGRLRARPQAGDGGVGAERALLGLVDAGGREAFADAGLEVGQRAVAVVERGAQDAGAARREQDRAGQGEAGRRAGRLAQDRLDGRDVGLRAAAEEGQREMERLGRDRPPDRWIGRGVAERDERVAGGQRQLEGDEEAELVAGRRRR